ncbi:hypothetical protein DFQ30_005353 [Apophysomyces sp. BC1015]|nr:hypothetical protein DFQ30_005353 [Apophysomyces sp. BC1015]KAG0183491.1 hypothetical protein DFQ29_002545 [Apophysomyces sp. BC1021]
MKLDLYKAKSQDQELFQVLDVVMAVVRTCIGDVDTPSKASSELTFYRKIAHIFDSILDDTNLVQKDGETMSSTSKDICRANAKAFENKYCMSGRRIDLLIESNDVELSTNEWKKEVPLGVSLKQQSKYIRMNKALLSKWLTYPVTDNMVSRLATLLMDWIGHIGYMFSVSPYQDVYVARHFANLQYPLYVADIPNFITALDALYAWKNHHLDMKDILVPAINKKHQRAYLNNLVYSDDTPSTSTSIH